GIVRPEAFAVALARSKNQDMPVGNALVKLCELKNEDLSAALYLQALVGEGVLALETAIEALSICHRQGATPQAALNVLGWRPAIQPQIDEVEELLTESGFVSRLVYRTLVGKAGSAFNL